MEVRRNPTERKSISSLFDVAYAVNKSTKNGGNIPELTGLPNGEVLTPTYNWNQYFDSKDWKAIPNIMKYNHFMLKKEEKSIVVAKELCNSPNVGYDTLQNTLKHTQKQSNQRDFQKKEKNICIKFCLTTYADLVAPKP